MNNLVTMENGKAMVSSKDVAEKFGKQHRQILDSIKRIIKTQPDFGRAVFCLSSYTSDQNKTLPCYDMTRDGFAMVAMGLTGKQALEWKVKYINAFNSMETSILNIDTRMNQLTIEQEKIKEAGSNWSKLGHEINKAKKVNKALSDELVKDVQMNLGLEG